MGGVVDHLRLQPAPRGKCNRMRRDIDTEVAAGVRAKKGPAGAAVTAAQVETVVGGGDVTLKDGAKVIGHAVAAGIETFVSPVAFVVIALRHRRASRETVRV